MSHLVCKGVCSRYRAIRPRKGLTRYGIGQRRCQACEIFIVWDGLWCPCCKGRLRMNPRNKNWQRKKQRAAVVNESCRGSVGTAGQIALIHGKVLR